MKTVITAMLAGLLALFCGIGRAADDAAAGRALYTSCATCHGPSGEGNAALKAPRLTHLEPVYLIAQLNKFRAGIRGGEGATTGAVQMRGMASTLISEQAVADVVAYIGTLENEAEPASVEGDVALGGDYYNQFCGACHGAGAVGNVALHSPRLVGSDDWYLLAQLQAFRSGQRGVHPDDKAGRQMRAMAAVLPTEQALKDVVAYIRSLEP